MMWLKIITGFIAISVKTKSFKVRSCSNLDKLIHSADSLKSCLPFSESLQLSVENNTFNHLEKKTNKQNSTFT